MHTKTLEGKKDMNRRTNRRRRKGGEEQTRKRKEEKEGEKRIIGTKRGPSACA